MPKSDKNDDDVKTYSTIVLTATPVGKQSQSFAYDVSTPSNLIVQDSTASLDCRLEPDYFEAVTESIERSKGLGSGFNIRLSFFDWGIIGVEKKPTSEVKKITKVIWRKPEKK
jgi:hypothetical protein